MYSFSYCKRTHKRQGRLDTLDLKGALKLIEAGADVEAGTRPGHIFLNQSPLGLASGDAQQEVAEILKARGAIDHDAG